MRPGSLDTCQQHVAHTAPGRPERSPEGTPARRRLLSPPSSSEMLGRVGKDYWSPEYQNGMGVWKCIKRAPAFGDRPGSLGLGDGVGFNSQSTPPCWQSTDPRMRPNARCSADHFSSRDRRRHGHPSVMTTCTAVLDPESGRGLRLVYPTIGLASSRSSLTIGTRVVVGWFCGDWKRV